METKTRGRDMAQHEFTSGPPAHAKAAHMARYTHTDWIVWYSRDETLFFAQVMTGCSIKAALLAMGTKGRAYGYHASTGGCYIIGWQMGMSMLYKFKRGWQGRNQLGGKP